MPSNYVRVSWRKLLINLMNDLQVDRNSKNYVLRRLENEGVTFLTKTLPKLSKAVVAGLESGRLILPLGYAVCPGKSIFPRFFSGWISKLFKRDLTVKDNPCAESLKKLRQLCEYFYKLSFAFLQKDEDESYEKAIKLELENKTRSVDPMWIRQLRRTFSVMFGCRMSETLSDVLTKHRPRFTPGAFFGSETLKDHFAIYKALPGSVVGTTAKHFRGISGFFKAYPSAPERLKLVDEGKTSKTLLVPKDSRGPRLISKEPLNLLRLQMSFFDYLTAKLEKVSNNRINFVSQEINRELARESSVHGKFATLDLKDASDRVLYRVCRGAFDGNPVIRWFLINARSSSTLVNGNLVPLAKVAGMGSGLTFPLLALLVFCSVVASVTQRTGLPFSKVAPFVYVYGDDLIVPTKWVKFAISGLESSGLAVNTDKSFSKSRFRESCGGDYLNGTDVSPVRAKFSGCGLGTTRDHYYGARFTGHHALLQLDRHCRELVKNGLLNAANYIYTQIESVYSDYGYTSGNSNTLGRYSVEPIYINDDFLHRRWVPSAVTINDARACPYKFLASTFLRGDAEDGLAYGELAIPRRIKLRKRLVTSIHLR